ncbi:MAG: threonine--tRNA ligase [Eubacteriales bacterium]|nr:threonine--tRNA ligase [Eubacteriales bacterium]
MKTAYDILKEASKINRSVIAAEVDGHAVDLTHKVAEGSEVKPLTFDDPEGKKIFWHTASHVLAAAVKRLYPSAKLTIGPAIENGFYYDIDSDIPFTPDILEKIETEMANIIKEDAKEERFTLPRDEAIALMEQQDEPYKVLLIGRVDEDEEISFYRQNEFVDLCAGPHLYSTGLIKAFKVLQCTGAYWEGNSENKMLQRIYGVAFTKKSDLDAYVARIEEAKKRDHRKLGRELDLFDIHDEGPGFPFFLPKGMILRNLLEDFWHEEHRKNGYQEIKTPIILNQELWHRSGHWDHYKDNMYTTKIDDVDYALKPMNCPGGMLVFKRKIHSYRDLPQRLAELGLVHRHELSGALHGLMRVRCFTQDDAHIFMTPEQTEDEIIGVMNLVDKFYNIFGFKYKMELSTRPENSMGSDEQWEIATEALRRALDKTGKPYIINEGDGAFYGPKIDFHLEDSLGRTWQCGTIQLDFQMPERFDLNYIGQDNERHRPIMIHRVVFGSIERFIGILTEHYAGAFPLWLAPVQIQLLPITDSNNDYCDSVYEKLTASGFRTECDKRNEKIGYRIREAQLAKIPYMLVLGDKEQSAGAVAVRSRKEGDKGIVMSVDEFIASAVAEVKERRNT